jgi:hypothetical protein
MVILVSFSNAVLQVEKVHKMPKSWFTSGPALMAVTPDDFTQVVPRMPKELVDHVSCDAFRGSSGLGKIQS